MLKAYYTLTKPGIIYGNVLTGLAGFLFASKWHIAVRLLAATLVGMSLVIASACVFNNVIDRGIDEKMARTKKRALVSGTISPRNALVYAAVLGALGFLTLMLWVNALTVVIGLIAFVDYIVFYGIGKRASVHGTLVGSISGSAPVVAGYTAVTGQFDLTALLLFLIMTAWQMPHFYAIAMYRFKDYKAAGLPVWPVKKGMRSTKVQIVAYVVLFIAANALLTAYRHAGYTYLIGMTLLGLLWLECGVRGFSASEDVKWARKMFFFSLIVLLGFAALLAVGSVLP